MLQSFRHTIGLILILILFNSSIQAQPPISAPISIQAGVLAFPNPKNGPNVYVEFPFAVNRDQFTFLPGDSTLALHTGSVYAEILITDTLGNHVDSANTYFGIRVKDSQEALRKDVRLFNELYVMLPPGVYKGRLDVLDASSKKEGSFLFDRIIVPSISFDSLHFSSPEFAYNINYIEDSAKASQLRLCKNGRDIIPNPMGLFSEDDSLLWIYAELYNLSYDSGRTGEFRVGYKITQPDGVLSEDFGETMIPKPGRTSIISSSLNISALEPGKYTLILDAFDPATNESASTSRQFIIIPESGYKPPMASPQYQNPLDTASFVTQSNIVRYLMSAQELALFNNLNDSGKIRYVERFFKDKDPSPTTPRNEYLEDAFRRYDYANEYFSSSHGKNDGWKSDRGRVLMQYGQWDERDEQTSPAYENPWERWYYRAIQGGVLFIFEDKTGYGDFRLVHSTANGEIFDSEWDQRVKDQNLQTY